jgi:hypothetical protein
MTNKLIGMANKKFDQKRSFVLPDAEMALFYHFLSRLGNDSDLQKRRDRCLAGILQELPAIPHAGKYVSEHPFLFNCLACIIRDLSREAGHEHPFAEQYNHWHRQWALTASDFFSDSKTGYLNGLAGILNYFIMLPERFGGTEQQQWIVSQLLGRLSQFSREGVITGQGGYTETGLANGITGMLLVLTRLKALRETVTLTLPIRESIQQLISLRQQVDQTEDKCSFFPYQISNQERLVYYDNRLSWYNSDLAYAMAFYKAGKLLQDSSYTKMAKIVALNTLLRVGESHTGITNGTIQHGAAGVAMLYKELADDMQLPVLRTGYRFWFDRMIQLVDADIEELSQCQGSAILDGLAGVALTLATYGQNEATEWKSVLLM